MNYILKRIGRQGGGQYVAKPGNRTSYTNKRNARTFATREEAEANRCRENERIVPAREDY